MQRVQAQKGNKLPRLDVEPANGNVRTDKQCHRTDIPHTTADMNGRKMCPTFGCHADEVQIVDDRERLEHHHHITNHVRE
jgi:hypothetical protein